MNTQISRLCLLDTPMLKGAGGEVPLQLRYRKALGLLGFLAAERNRNHSRAVIASLFWPDLDEPAARVNLRQVLSILSKLFNTTPFHTALIVDRHFIALQNHALLHLDITDLETLQRLPNSKVNNLEHFKEDSLLTGEFMAGYSLPGCEEYEYWLADKRAYFRSCQIRLLNTLITQAQDDRQSGLVISYAQKIQQLDPDNESLLREVMRLCSENGQTRLALRLYENFTQRMQRELGVLPDSKSQSLYSQLTQQLNEQPARTSQLDQFPAIEKISPVVVVHLQWRCSLSDPEAAAQQLFDADHYSRKLICDEIGAFHLNSAGHGAFFYFGWPLALEDNAWLAVRSTIRLMHYARTHPEIDLRAGVHTGTLFSSLSAALPDLLGNVTEETSLLCQSASDGQILLSEPCYRLLERKVQARKVTERRRRNDGSLSGAFLLVDEPGWFTESDSLPLPEQQPLYETLSQQRDRIDPHQHPLLVNMTGPAGSGKTLMLSQWLKHQRQSGDRVFKLRCYPDRQQQPLFPLISCLRQLLGFQADETVKPDILKERLRRHGWDQLLQQPVLIDLMAYNAHPTEENIQQAFDAISQLLHGLNGSCLLVWIEDGHWIDATTLALIEHLADLTSCPLMVLLSARKLPDTATHPAWFSLTLPRLSHTSANRLLKFFSRSSQNWRSPDESAQLLELTDHNPFLLKVMANSSEDNQLPGEVLQYFSYRIDQLDEWRDSALQLALYWPDIHSDQALQIGQIQNLATPNETIEQLITTKLLQWQDKTQLAFTPPLLQQVLASLNPPSRQRYVHRMLALQLEQKQRGKTPFEIKARLAYHWCAAGEQDKAADLYLRCGQSALQQRRYTDAAHCLGAALKLDTSVDFSLELRVTLLNDLAQSRIMAFGYGDLYAFKAASEALQLAKQVADETASFRSLYLLFLGIGSVDTERSRLQAANLLYDHADTPAQLTLAHWALANSHFWMGHFQQSRSHAEQSLLLTQQVNVEELNNYSHENPAVLAMGFLAWAWCFDGQPEQANRCCEQLLALPAETLTPSSHCYQLFFAASTLTHCNEHAYALEYARACHEIATRLQHHLWLCASELLILSLSATADEPVRSEQIDWLINGIHSAYADGLPMAVLMGAEALIRSDLKNMARILLKRTLDSTINQEHDLLSETLQRLLHSL
ncbi:AAA family ATPase [Nitrincola iocasae]|uniref:AAA family ATPase n=1 Tax=Nitrincola iocasae TaxID=2614693 RepID=A0A5J6LCK5_9GAMM|nr:AAA family ATPase [Nitrincola iocasae]QEW06230.1 AAA family ATPase [Nitrincola iocasae]